MNLELDTDTDDSDEEYKRDMEYKINYDDVPEEVGFNLMRDHTLGHDV